MYVCMYLCMYVCMYVFMYLCVYVFQNTCITEIGSLNSLHFKSGLSEYLALTNLSHRDLIPVYSYHIEFLIFDKLAPSSVLHIIKPL